MDLFAALAFHLPWWGWGLVAGAAFFAFNAAWVSALSVTSAAGANHLQLSYRQRRMARWWARLSLCSIPLAAILGIAAFSAALYRLWHAA